MAYSDLCVDEMGANSIKPIGLYECSKNYTFPHGTQYFLLNKKNEIRFKSHNDCWDANSSEMVNNKLSIKIYGCHGGKGNQKFNYDIVRKVLTVSVFY